MRPVQSPAYSGVETSVIENAPLRAFSIIGVPILWYQSLVQIQCRSVAAKGRLEPKSSDRGPFGDGGAAGRAIIVVWLGDWRASS